MKKENLDSDDKHKISDYKHKIVILNTHNTIEYINLTNNFHQKIVDHIIDRIYLYIIQDQTEYEHELIKDLIKQLKNDANLYIEMKQNKYTGLNDTITSIIKIINQINKFKKEIMLINNTNNESQLLITQLNEKIAVFQTILKTQKEIILKIQKSIIHTSELNIRLDYLLKLTLKYIDLPHHAMISIDNSIINRYYNQIQQILSDKYQVDCVKIEHKTGNLMNKIYKFVPPYILMINNQLLKYNTNV